MANQKAEIIISARDETKIAFNSVKSSLGSLNSLAGGLSGSLGGFLPLLSATAFAGFVKGGIDTLDMLGDLSDRTGVAASTLAGFQLVAAQSDTSLEALGRGINKLSIFMAENGEAAKKLGLDAKDPAEAFIQLSDLISKIEDPQQRAAVANKVLGKSFQELLPALLQGGDALRKQIEAGKEFSGVTPEAVKAAQEFNDQLDLLKTKANAAGVTLAGPLLIGLNEIITAFGDAKKAGVGFFGTIEAFNTSPDQIGPKLADTADRLRKLQKAYDDLDPKKSFSNKLNDAIYGDRSTLSKQIEVAKQELASLQGLEDLRRDKLRKAEQAGSKAFKPSDIKVGDFSGSSSKGSSRDADAEAAKRFIESLKKETETLGLSKVALLEYEAAHLKLNEAQKTIVASLIDKTRAQEAAAKATEEEAAADEERRKSIAETVEYQKRFNEEVERVKDALDPTRAYTREIDKLKEMYRLGRISAVEFGEAQKMVMDEMRGFSGQAKTDFEEIKNAIEGFSRDSARTLVDWAFGASNSFEDVANDFAKAVARMIIQKQLLDRVFNDISNGSFLENIFGGLFGGSGSDVSPSSSYGGIIGMDAGSGGGFFDSIKSFFGGFRAAGGDVMANKAYIVGEKGPELFMPNGPGSIVPNHELGGSMSVTNVFHLSGPTDMRTQQQIAASAYSGLRRAAMRNA